MTPAGRDPQFRRWTHLDAGTAPSPGESVRDDFVPHTFRTVVATSWCDVVPVRTALMAFARVVPREAPVTAVVTVPHDIGPRDTEALHVVLQDIAINRPLPSITLESFEETARRPAAAVLVPGGDPHVLISEMGEFVTVLHILVDALKNGTAPQPPRTGVRRGLAERLDEFADLPPVRNA